MKTNKKLMETTSEEEIFTSYKKVLIFGAESTGKSSLIQRIKTNNFQDNINNTDNK